METVIKSIITALTALLILTFGLNSFVKLQNAACETVLEKLKIDVAKDVELVSPQSLERKTYSTLSQCPDKIIFLDLKRINAASIAEYPEIKNSVKSGSRNNVFMMKNEKIVKTLEAGNIETSYPYLLCVKLTSGKLNLIMEGKGSATKITADCADDCTAFVASADVEKVKADAAEIGESGAESGNKIEVKRKFCRFKENSTKVEITIKAKDKLTDLKYIEYMPKDCINDLAAYLENATPDYYKIKADPLIMWHFDSMKKGGEETITYVLKMELSDYCKELISGMGVLSVANNAPYLSKELPYTTLFLGDPAFSINLDEYFKDPDDDAITYSAVGNSFVSAYASGNEVKLSGSAPIAETEVSITASDSANSVPAVMKARVLDTGACLDSDSDGYGRNCPSGEDCNDNGNSINPGKTDIQCDGIDQNCDGADAQNSYDCYNADNDGDEYRMDIVSETVSGCSRPSTCKEKPNIADCNDDDKNIRPAQAENCNDDIDDNCNGISNDGCDCTGAASQECGASPCLGVQVCSNGQWSGCTLLISSCGTKDCSSNNYYELSGNACNYYSYPECYNSCTAPGACMACTCSSPTASSQTFNPSACQYIAGCTGATSGSIANYPSGSPCSGGTCDGSGNCAATPSCINECTSGAKECTSSTAYRECGNYDSDSCLEWSSATSCSAGQTCSVGSCIIPQLEAIATPTTRSGTTYYFNLIIRETHGLSVTFDNVDRIFTTGNPLPDGTIDWIKDKCGGTNIFSECIKNNRYFGTSSIPNTYKETWHGSINGIEVSKLFEISTDQYP